MLLASSREESENRVTLFFTPLKKSFATSHQWRIFLFSYPSHGAMIGHAMHVAVEIVRIPPHTQYNPHNFVNSRSHADYKIQHEEHTHKHTTSMKRHLLLPRSAPHYVKKKHILFDFEFFLDRVLQKNTLTSRPPLPCICNLSTRLRFQIFLAGRGFAYRVQAK